MREEKLVTDSAVLQQNTIQDNMAYIENKPCYNFFKRLFDVVCSCLCLIILLIPLIIVGIVVLLDCPGASPIYVQKRIGKDGKEFKFYKFRSMVPKADEMLEGLLEKNEMDGPVFKIKDDPRITKVGRFIRKTSIDELPQLWNVLKGDMSLVGPRPPLPREVEFYEGRQHLRLSVIPGITGNWQIPPSRHSIPFEKWIELDLEYIKSRSFKTDIVILFKTIGAVFGAEGE